MSIIGLGRPEASRAQGSQALDELVRIAFERGVNLFEVSSRGGSPYDEALARIVAGQRAEVVLATTLQQREAIIPQVERILKAFSTDHVDICCISGAKNDYTLKSVCERELAELQKAKANGKVARVGLDCRPSPLTARKLVESGGLDVLLLPLSLVRREFAEEVLPAAEAKRIGVIAIEPFNYGELLRNPKGLEKALGSNAEEAFSNALEFVLAFPVTSVLADWGSSAGLKKALSVASQFRGLSEGAALRTAFGKERNLKGHCRNCTSCLPCPVKINIPQVHRLYVMATHYGFLEYARACYAVEKVKASECIRCGRCDRRCPFNLPVEDTVIKAHKLLQ